MRGLRKSKRVSWASDVNLCQVRLFLSEESPSLVGQGGQDHLQAKTSWLSHPAGTSADDILPPGFEGGNPANHLQIKLSDIPEIKWKCPPRVILDLNWRVAAGEESSEMEIQNQREMRVLEAVFPHPSAIPSNPIFPSELEDSHHHNDDHVPMIPITPIEDEDSTDSPPPYGTSETPSMPKPQPVGPVISPQPMIPNIPNIPSSEKLGPGPAGIEPDVVAAASAAFAAIKSNEQGNLIDPDLLIKLLNNPKLIEKFVQDCGAAAASKPPASPPAPPLPLPDPSYTATPSGPGHFFGPPPNGSGPVYTQVPPQPVQVKDMSYYKNLIQQHGGERQEGPPRHKGFGYNQGGANQELVNQKPREVKKIMKPCIYFNSSRGCRHGANCAYQHDATAQQRSSSIQEVQSAKRMKMDREISS